MAEPQDKREQIGTAGMQVARSQPQGMVEISACVITKNEEKNIGRWLNCMRVAADEMIVVDTGSTDRTCELAKAAGARLYHFAWRDDFAAAKNYAIEQARGRWILFLDADEYFTPATVGAVRPLLRRLTPHHEVAGVLCRLTNIDLDDGGRLSTASMQLRMFRNLRSLRYVGRIHEALDVPHNRSIELTREVEIYHTGYSHSIIKAKLQRNKAMLEKRIAERGGTIKPTERSYLLDIASTTQLSITPGKRWRRIRCPMKSRRGPMRPGPAAAWRAPPPWSQPSPACCRRRRPARSRRSSR